MKLAGPLVLVACLAAACAPSAVRAPCPTASASASLPTEARAATPEAKLSLRTDVDAPGLLRGELRLPDGTLAGRALAFRPRAATLESVDARDADGALALRRDTNGSAVVLSPERAAKGELVVTWSAKLAPTPPSDASFMAIAEPTQLRVRGADALILPDADAPLGLALELGLGGVVAEAASSFGLGRQQHLTERADELREATYVAGDLGRASFHAIDGDDFTVWAGYTTFDGRWVGAETASVRAAIDDWVGLAPDKRKGTSLLLLPEKRETATVSIQLSARGLVARVDPRATWSAPVRLRAAQALTQRWIGGALWVGDRDHDASGAFFSEGFSRAIALVILDDASIFEPADHAAELNTLLSALDLSPLGGATADALASATDRSEATRVSAARGALGALSLDAELRKLGKGASLKSFVRALLASAAERKADTVSVADFDRALHDALGDGAASLLASLRSSREPALLGTLAAPCYRLARGKVAPFELGFAGTSSEAGFTIAAVTRGSEAERAGLRVGDVLQDLRYEDGRSSVPVVAMLRRPDGASKKLTFRPAGTSKPGRWFERDPRAPKAACP